MSTVLIVVGLMFAIFLTLPLLADPKTKLFRRVWSTEVATRTKDVIIAQNKAIEDLMLRYEISASDDTETLRKSTAALMADALVFDLKHPNNAGIEITQVLAREIPARCPRIAG